jgi:hypothetical protein
MSAVLRRLLLRCHDPFPSHVKMLIHEVQNTWQDKTGCLALVDALQESAYPDRLAALQYVAWLRLPLRRSRQMALAVDLMLKNSPEGMAARHFLRQWLKWNPAMTPIDIFDGPERPRLVTPRGGELTSRRRCPDMPPDGSPRAAEQQRWAVFGCRIRVGALWILRYCR